MKNTRTHILKNLTYFLLMVAVLTSVTSMFSVQTAYADDPPPPAATAPAPATPPAAGTSPATPPADTPKAAAEATKPATPASGLGNSTVGQVLPNNDIIVMLSKVLSIVLSMISHLLWPLLMFAGGLMKSDFLYTGAIDLKLSEMWIQVRNLVNIAYVLLLLAVALYNVVGLGETVGMLELKKALPKIILGLILVNFSYAGVKVVLDVINVGTTFAFSIGRTDARLTQATALQVNAAQGPICDTLGTGQLAANIGKDAKDAAMAKECSDKKGAAADKCKTQIEKVYSPKTKSAETDTAMCVPDDKGGLEINPKVKTYLKNWNVDSSLMIIAIKFMNIQDLPKVSAQASKGGITSLTINMLFSVIMFLIYAVSFITLVIVLFTRAAILWMIIIFSPVIVLNTTFPIPGVGGNTSKIIKTLIAPMLIGFVLSIGFILLSTMQNINYNGQGQLVSNAPTSSIDTFQDLLVAIGSIVFLWYGIQTATSDTLSEKITGPILEGAQSAGTWLAKAPFKYTPLFQVKTPHAGHADLQDLGKIGVGLDQAKYAIDQMISNADTKRRSDALKAFGVDMEVTMKMKDVKTLDHLSQALAGHPDLNALKTKPDSEEFKEFKKAVGKVKDGNPDLVISGKGDYNEDFKKLHDELFERPTPNMGVVEKLIPKFMPAAAAKAAAATPATQTPAEVSATMKTDSTVNVLVNELKAGTTPNADKTAAAIQKYSDALKSGGTADVAARGQAIAKHFVDQGATNKAGRTAAMNAALAELKALMPDKEATDLINAINAAP